MMGLPQVAFEAPSIDWTKRKPSTPPAAKTPTPFASSYAGQSAAAKNQKAHKITTINADGAHGHNGHSGRSGHYPGEHGADAGDGGDGVRAEDIRLRGEGEDADMEMTIDYVEELGAGRLVHGRIGEARLAVSLPSGEPLSDRLHLVLDRDRLHIFDRSTGLRVRPETATAG